MNAPVDFHVEFCPCPGMPHLEGDHVYLEPVLTMEMGLGAYLAMQRAGAAGEDRTVAQIASYFPRCIKAWTFTDEKGALREITKEAVSELLPWDRGGFLLADKVSELYGKTLAAPLLVRPSKSSERGQTGPSTSANPPSGSTPRTPSRPSSRQKSAGKPSAVPAP